MISDSNFFLTSVGALLTARAIWSNCSALRLSRLAAISSTAAAISAGVETSANTAIDSATDSGNSSIAGNVVLVAVETADIAVTVVGGEVVAVVVGLIVVVWRIDEDDVDRGIVVVVNTGKVVDNTVEVVVVGKNVVSVVVDDIGKSVVEGSLISKVLLVVVHGTSVVVVVVVLVVVLVVVVLDVVVVSSTVLDVVVVGLLVKPFISNW